MIQAEKNSSALQSTKVGSYTSVTVVGIVTACALCTLIFSSQWYEVKFEHYRHAHFPLIYCWVHMLTFVLPNLIPDMLVYIVSISVSHDNVNKHI